MAIDAPLTPLYMLANPSGRVIHAPSIPGSGDPFIAFTDILSAPRSGWSVALPNQGACVTLWGFNLGTSGSRGSDYVTVGDVDLTADTDYPETWAEKGKPVQFLQRISFHLNSTIPLGTQDITVTVGGVTSNVKTVKVTENNIYFLDTNSSGANLGTYEDPWTGAISFVQTMAPGDVLYFNGLITEPVISTAEPQQLMYLNDARTSGTIADPISWTSYPNGQGIFDNVNYTSSASGGLNINCHYHTFSKLQINSKGGGMNGNGNGFRAIGNDVTGPTVWGNGTGTIVVKKEANEVFGNYTHGCTTANRLDHAIYINGCMEIIGAQVAYNQVKNHNVAEGPLIVINHQDPRCLPGQVLTSHFVYNNWLDATAYRTRGIGSYDQSYDDGETPPDTSYVYNNILIGCGHSKYWQAMYQNSADVAWWNNIVIDSSSTCLTVGGTRVIKSSIKNNIFIQNAEAIAAGEDYVVINNGTCDVDYNLYYAGNNDPTILDSNAVQGDPGIVYDLNTCEMTVGAICNNAGSPDLTVGNVVLRDFYVRIRPSANNDIGAVQYQE